MSEKYIKPTGKWNKTCLNVKKNVLNEENNISIKARLQKLAEKITKSEIC